MELVYRKLTQHDAAVYRALRQEALETQPRAFGKSPEEFHEVTLDEIVTSILGADGFFVGAFDGERLVGVARFARQSRQKERHKGHVYGVYVAPTHLRRGVARAMISAIIAEVTAVTEASGVEQLLLAVGTHNTAARALYTSLGFVSFGTEPRAMKVGSEYVDEEHMVLYLR